MNYPLAQDMLTILGTSVQAIASIIAIAAALLLFSEEIKHSDSSSRADKLNESINYLAAIYFHHIPNFRNEALDKGPDYVDEMMKTLSKKSLMVKDRELAQYHAYNIRLYHQPYYRGIEIISGKNTRLFGGFIAFTLIFSLGSMYFISISSQTKLVNFVLFSFSLLFSFICISGAALELMSFYDKKIREKIRKGIEVIPFIKSYLES